MARDDSDSEVESPLSGEGEDVSNREDTTYEGSEDTDSEITALKEGAHHGETDAAKSTIFPCRPPRPPGRISRPGASRLPLAPRPSRPAVSRLLDDGEVDDAPPSEAELQKRREENIKALVNNSLETCRQPLMSKFLSVLEGQVVLRKPFQSPMQGAPPMSDALRRKLAARRHFVPWGSSTRLSIPTLVLKPIIPASPADSELELQLGPAPPTVEPALPEGVEPLVLWQPPPGTMETEEAAAPVGEAAASFCDGSVVVDPMLVRFLRPHQREGVQFMFDCVTGQRLEGKEGCILADDMGLGKTLQGISLMWTLLTSGHPLLGDCPLARRAIIVCPTSLVSNWENECVKWLQGRLKTLAMCESSREDVLANIGLFLHPSNVYKVLIISYETFRMHAERFQVPHACDLLLCDEAHRLKNDATLTNRALDNLSCKRRVLLSGTPMQNHLDEFFAMVDFCNPGVLGAPAQFRKYYELPILAGREPDASPEQVVLGEERSRELSGLTNNFILRRTNKLLSEHLPPKVIEVVCCRLTDLQRQLYCHFLQSKAARRVLNGRTSGVLSAITSLKKLCNHPKLIYDAVHSKAAWAAGGGGGEDCEGGGRADGFEDVGALFPPGLFDNGRVGRGGMAAGWEAVSGKLAVLSRMLHVLYTETTDRIVLVSNYTSALDLFAQLCRERGYPFVRLDGTTTINKRQKLVKVFNDPLERQFAFLLSSKAGGCGLNLIGANRLVLFDPDWNPANDQQAAARVWRDGQRKRVFVYRFLSTGSIEEKVYQRQLSKEGLKQLVSKTGKAAANVMTAEDLRELFRLNADSWSDTYDYMCGGPGLPDSTAMATGPIDLTSVVDAYDDINDPSPGAIGATAGRGTAEPRMATTGRLPPVYKCQSGEPAEEDLANWGHHPSPETVPDAVMRRVASPDVSFIFSCSVAGKVIEGGDEEEHRLENPSTAGRGGTQAAAMMAARGCGHSEGLRGGGRIRSLAMKVGTSSASAVGTPGCRTPTVSAAAVMAPATPSLTGMVTPAPAPESGVVAASGPISQPLQGAPVAGQASRPLVTAPPRGKAPPLPVSERRIKHIDALGPPSLQCTPTTATRTSAATVSTGAAENFGPSAAAVTQTSGYTREPQLQPSQGLARGPGAQSTSNGTRSSNSAKQLHSSVTGAMVKSLDTAAEGPGCSDRLISVKPILSAAGLEAASVGVVPRAAGMIVGCPPLQHPTRTSNPPNEHPVAIAAMASTPAAAALKAPQPSRSASAAMSPPVAVEAARLPLQQTVQAWSKSAAVRTATVDEVHAVGASYCGGAKAVRRCELMEEGPGGAAAPKPKRQRAPGWYIDTDDDDFL